MVCFVTEVTAQGVPDSGPEFIRSIPSDTVTHLVVGSSTVWVVAFIITNPLLHLPYFCNGTTASSAGFLFFRFLNSYPGRYSYFICCNSAEIWSLSPGLPKTLLDAAPRQQFVHILFSCVFYQSSNSLYTVVRYKAYRDCLSMCWVIQMVDSSATMCEV